MKVLGNPRPLIVLATLGLGSGCVLQHEPPTPSSVRTGAPARLKAGDILRVECSVLDPFGVPFLPANNPEPVVHIVPEDAVRYTEAGAIQVMTALELEVHCAYPLLALEDVTPAKVQVEHSRPARVTTAVEESALTAGDTVHAQCEVFDAFDNPIDTSAPTLHLDPQEDSHEIEGWSARITRSGTYQLRCDMPATETSPQTVEVVPGRPDALTISRTPDQDSYTIDEVVHISTVVTDEFSNRIPDVEATITDEYSGESVQGEASYQYSQEGAYVVTARVPKGSDGDGELLAITRVLINAGGPSIVCGSDTKGPRDGETVRIAPGARINFTGLVQDTQPVTRVTLNGLPAAIAPNGTFQRPLETHFGLNFVRVEATDAFGAVSVRTCAFLASNRFLPENAFLQDAVSLKVGQRLLDDGNHTDAVFSLTNIIDTIINSGHLRQEAHRLLTEANPLVHDCWDGIHECGIRKTIVNFVSADLTGEHSSSLQLIDGGWLASIQARDVSIRIRAEGHLYDFEGDISFSSLTLKLDLETHLNGGRPAVRVRDAQASLEGLTTSFEGVDGGIANLLIELAKGKVREEIEKQLAAATRTELGKALDEVLLRLDEAPRHFTLDVPSFDRSTTIPLSLGTSFTSVSADRSRTLFGLGTRVSSQAAIADPSPGVALPEGPTLGDPELSQSVAVSIHVGLLNQTLHALWRAGFFKTEFENVLSVSAPLPPVAVVHDDGRIEISLGAVHVEGTYPDLSDEPIDLRAGVRAVAEVDINQDMATLRDVDVAELYLSLDSPKVDASLQQALEETVFNLARDALATALEGSSTSIAIPTIMLPTEIQAFGFPPGISLGLLNTSLRHESPHLVVRTDLGAR